MMRQLLSNKNLPTTESKRTARNSHILPHLPPMATLLHPFELIIEIAAAMPLLIDLECIDTGTVQLQIAPFAVSISLQGKSSLQPMAFGRMQWIKLSLPATKKAELRWNGERKRVYCNSQQWEKENMSSISSITTLNVSYLIEQLRGRGEANESRNSIGSFMRSKFSERQHIKSKLAIRRPYDNKIREQQRSSPQALPVSNSQSRTKHWQASTLELQQHGQKQSWPNRKQVNTCTSIRIEGASHLSTKSNDIQLPRRLRKIRLGDPKHSLSQKQSIQDSELFGPIKERPKFYHPTQLSQQQIDIKRRKFDSQFITRKQIPAQPPERNDSEVTEDIIRLSDSKAVNNNLEDTFQRGLEVNPNQLPTEQSGTLCESVFE